jgi:hypothetical protein
MKIRDNFINTPLYGCMQRVNRENMTLHFYFTKNMIIKKITTKQSSAAAAAKKCAYAMENLIALSVINANLGFISRC